MPLKILRQDITKIKCDAIVNPTDTDYSHAGGTDEAVHAAAGAELYEACRKKGSLGVGEAVITPAFDLPSKYVIHTVGPRYVNGLCGEELLLRSAYGASLALAAKNGCKSVALPLISSGTFGFPKDRVLRIAMDVIGEFLLENEMVVYLLLYDKESTAIGFELFLDVREYIDDNYVVKRRELPTGYLRASEIMPRENGDLGCDFTVGACDGQNIEELLGKIDESFSEMLLRKIDESGMTDAECYKKANIDRKLFSKIRSDKNYRPSKNTALAFAIALRLSLPETKEMLEKAGFALSHSSKFDIIVEYFIVHGQYDLFAINETLIAFDQKLLGM